MTDDDDELQFFTTEDVGRILRTSRPTLYFWRQQGIGPPSIRRGTRVLYPVGALKQWLRQQEEVDAAKRRAMRERRMTAMTAKQTTRREAAPRRRGNKRSQVKTAS
jgi:hypothetical protein